MAKIAVFVPICIKSLFPRGFSDDGGAADVSLTSSSSTSAAAAAGADGSVSGSSQKLVELRPRSAASLRSNSPIRVKEDGEEVFDPYSPGLSPPPMSSRVGRYRQDLPIPSSPEDRASQRHQFQTHHQLETRTASSSTIVSSPSAARIPGENYFTQNLPLVHADGPIGIIPIEELTTPVGVRSSMSTADSEIQYINQSNDNGSAGGVATGSSDGMGLRLAISANEQETAGSPLAFYNYADSPMMAPGRYGTTTLPAGHRGGAPMTTPTSTTDDNNLQLQQQQHTSNPTSTISRPQFPRGNVPLAIEEEDEDAATSTVTSGEPTTSTAPPAHNPHSSGSSDGGAPSSPIPIVHHSHNSTLPPSSASPDNTFSSASMMMFGLDQDGMPEKIATKLTGLIDCLYILLHSDIFDSVHVESGGKLRTSNRMIIQSLDELLGEQLSHLVFSLLDILVLPLVGNEEEKEQVMANKDQSVASPLKGSFPPLSPQSTSPSAGLKKELSQPRSASPKFSSPSVALAAADALLAEIRQIAAETGDVHLDGSPTFDHHGVTGVAIKDPIVSTPTEIAAKRATELKTIKDMIAVHATTLVGVLIKYGKIK